ncbi:MAG: universal stress protein [Chloroflexi bacterium]|nr:MAG: universal stress protein [Chloroflexota bacterium]
MSEESQEGGIRKILIVLDASPNSIAALGAAAELASLLDAELTAVYIEDINLLRYSSFPFAREVSYYSARVIEQNQQTMELQLRAQASRARKAVQSIAERHSLRSEFRVVRGLIPAEVLKAAVDVDLIILGRAGWSHRRRLGSTAKLVIAQSPRHALIFPQGQKFRLPLGLIFDGTVASMRALTFANNLLKDQQAEIAVIILAQEIHQARELQKEIENWVDEHDQQVSYHWLIGPDTRRLGAFIRSEGYRSLILPAPVEPVAIETITAFMDEVEIPVLLIR